MAELTENVKQALTAMQKSSADMDKLTRKNMAFQMMKMEASVKMNVLHKLSEIVQEVKG
ncbi:MAG: hypothetical protein ACTHL1_10275 [Burkholderiaceae bacterium]